jgi:hypothetical protein
LIKYEVMCGLYIQVIYGITHEVMCAAMCIFYFISLSYAWSVCTLKFYVLLIFFTIPLYGIIIIKIKISQTNAFM